MINIGFLFASQEYKIAQYHCYGRFLSSIRGSDSTLDSCADKDMNVFNSIYLPNGLDDPMATTVVSIRQKINHALEMLIIQSTCLAIE